MRTLWPNLDGDEGLETVLEVPVPDEMFASSNSGKSWRVIKTWVMMRPPHAPSSFYARRAVEIQLLLGVIGAPFISLPISSPHTLNLCNIKSYPIERSMASYIVQQYIAASGGEHALRSIESMCAIGKVKMAASSEGEDLSRRSKMMRSMKQGKAGELGGFVLWQKTPHLWSLELVLSGFKISAGCDGKAAWRQTPWQCSPASRGLPRLLRRSVQGLDPRRTADLFSNAICIGEKAINGEDCFVLKLEADASALMGRSSSNAETMRHTIWGCFSQKTGLLVHLQDSHSLRIKSPRNELLWETRTESSIQDYRTVDGVNIAHGGRTTVSVSRLGGGDGAEGRTRTRMEEIWSIEEVDFNVKGLSTDCFLPPADLDPECDTATEDRLRYEVLDKCARNCGSRGGTKKVVAIDDEDYDSESDDDDDAEL